MSDVHICAPRPDKVWIERFHCHNCERRRFAVLQHIEWYGVDATCLRCGERYSDEGRLPRPFERGWRERSKESARRLYRRFTKRDMGGECGKSDRLFTGIRMLF